MLNKFETSIGSNYSTANKQSSNFVENFDDSKVNQTDKRTDNETDLSAMCKYMTDNLKIMSNRQMDPFDDSFNQLNQTKSPVITKANITSLSVSKTPTSLGKIETIILKTID